MQAKMMWIMPLVFSVMFFFFPAGLVLYWLTNNILSIAQQWIINTRMGVPPQFNLDRKSTRLNSSHSQISYAVFCLKKKKNKKKSNVVLADNAKSSVSL